MRLALYEPDIPQNTGTLLRLAACFNLPVDIIEPCGFVFNDQKMRRAGMDYLNIVDCTRHISWARFLETHCGRIVLLADYVGTQYVNYNLCGTNPCCNAIYRRT